MNMESIKRELPNGKLEYCMYSNNIVDNISNKAYEQVHNAKEDIKFNSIIWDCVKRIEIIIQQACKLQKHHLIQ